MKRALKIILPILLSITIIICIGWYLLEYDRDFTRDMLVSCARSFEEQGNHTASKWLYDIAYRHANHDETVAIELAEQFKADGNFTKAEYTLSNAIADGGSVELYIALCKTYVEQDKLLDAVTMLDNVADPVIKQQLESQRPKAPTATPESGYYNQYISVTLSGSKGTIYTSTGGEYPSTQTAPYSEPIALQGGETTISALVVGKNGLVSPLSIFGYTIGGVIEEVTLTDPAIERTIRQQLQVSDDHVLYSDELWNISSLVIPKDAQDLSDLSKLPFLKQLAIRDTQFESMSNLSCLSSLEELIITDTVISTADLQIIAALPKLTSLTLTGCNLSGISELSAATKLTYLDLSNNTIQDLSALASMPDLEYAALSHNAITELTVIGSLSKLTELDASYNSITTTAPLVTCSALAVLDLTGNSLTTLEGLDKIPGLRQLSVAFNQLTDVSLLAVNTTLGALDISNNAITDITALGTLNSLVTFNFSYNQVTALPTFSKNCALVTIKGSENQLTSLKPLSSLGNLNYVIMDQNAGITSISCLANCYQLVEVSVYGTKVTDASALKDMNVIVKYAPI